MDRKRIGGSTVWALALASMLPTAGIQAQERPISWDIDARLGYVGSQRRASGVMQPRNDELRARVRVGAYVPFGTTLGVKVRAAGRFGTAQERFEFYLHDHPRQIEGLALGQISIDEAYVHYATANQWSLRVGRLQTKFELAGVATKSLDRNDSPSSEVTWTDGGRLTYSALGDWQADLILQHNPRGGPTNVVRPPLDVSGSASRITVFAAVSSSTPAGPIIQRSVALTYIPQVLPAGDGGGMRDYVGITGRVAAAWPLLEGTRRFMLAGETGYAPNTPSREDASGPDLAGVGGGLAMQVSANLFDLVPGHHLGFVYGRTEPGWLLSPDFRNDGHLLEGRYQWRFSASHSMEARLRRRRDLTLPPNVPGGREETDAFIRLTLRF